MESKISHYGVKGMHREEVSHSDDFNIEDEYGGLLDLLESYIPEMVGDTATHHGVKGMHWGVRKEEQPKNREPLKSLGPESVSRKTASGETITLQKMKPGSLSRSLGRISKKYREGYSKRAALNILDGSGKKIGQAYVQKKNDEELYLNWLEIKKSARGKGYATAVMKAGRDFGKQQGFKRMTLEVPGKSPDARHIYENLGFKATGKTIGSSNDMWGGLTSMVYEFDGASHSDSGTATNQLSHHGVKGMRWGVRKQHDDSPNPGYSAKRRAEDQQLFGKGGVKRINRRLNEGMKLSKAQQREGWRSLGKGAIAIGSFQAARILLANKDVIAQSIAIKAETERGRSAAAQAMGLPRKPTHGPTYAKKSRGGVHKITTL